MLCIDKSCDTAAFLDFCYHMQCYGRLTTGLRSVDLHDPSFWNTAKSQCHIQAQRAGRNGLHVHMVSGITQFHNGTFSEIFLNFCDSRFQCLDLIILSHFNILLNLLFALYCSTCLPVSGKYLQN